MRLLTLPYVADIKIGKEWHENCEVTDLNAKTAWVRLPTGEIRKFHATKHKHKFKIKFVSTEV